MSGYNSQGQVQTKSKKKRKEQEKADKEKFALEEQSWAFDCEYIGGHNLYPKEKKTRVHIEANRLIIEKLDNLEIPYARITNLDNMDERRITKTRVLLTGLQQYAPKKKEKKWWT
jgi:hypothetical protein